MSNNEEKLHVLYKSVINSSSSSEFESSLKFLRMEILVNGIPELKICPPLLSSRDDLENLPPDSYSENELTLRGKIWKLFLGVHKVDVDKYVDFVSIGENAKFKFMIRKDTRRYNFFDLSQLRRFVRIFNAFCNETHEIYLQNYLAFGMLLVHFMPEVDSYFCFKKIYFDLVPSYYMHNSQGQIEGSELISTSIEIMDPELKEHLKSIGYDIKIFSLSYLRALTLTAYNTKSRVRLLDLLICVGPQILIFSFVSLILSNRKKLLNCDAMKECLKTFENNNFGDEEEELMFIVIDKLKTEKSIYNSILELHKIKSKE